MMFSSLRSRLWLSYALIILVALGITAVILVVTLLMNPVIYRSTIAGLNAVQATVLENNPDLGGLPPRQIQEIIRNYDNTFKVRILVYDSQRNLIADSRAATPPLVKPRRYQLLRPTLGLRDTAGKPWLYTVTPLPDGNYLVTATPRPKPPLLAIFQGELFLPFVEAGLVALLLSLAAAFLLSRWVGDPLQEVMLASREMPSAQTGLLAPRGPREVQELTRAFNEMMERVQASQKSQREFVANVSHELKTPLTSVQGFAQALLDGIADTPEARQQAASVIYDESGRMQRMVVDLLDLARLDAGTFDLQRMPVDLAALLNSVAEKFTPQARAADVRLKVELGNLPVITGDGDHLAQVFTNLVDNALKYTPAGGSIALRASQGEGRIQVDVSDTGTGIAPGALPHIFDRFYQADPSRKGGEKHGVGLGLAIVKEIVTAHGGTISVRSVPGQGSTFTLHLPLTPPEATTVVSKRKK